MRKRAIVVANSEELAKLPLARRNNITTPVSRMKSICIDAPQHALSIYGDGRIDVPNFADFRSQKAFAVGKPNLTHNKATATSVFRKNGCNGEVNGTGGDDGNDYFDEKWWCCGGVIDSSAHGWSTLPLWSGQNQISDGLRPSVSQSCLPKYCSWGGHD